MSLTFFQPGGAPVQTYAGQPSASGVNHLVAATPGASIWVLSYALQATGTVNPNLQDTAGTALTPAWNFQAREGISRPPAPGFYYFVTGLGKGLDISLSAGVGVNVEIQYVVF